MHLPGKHPLACVVNIFFSFTRGLLAHHPELFSSCLLPPAVESMPDGQQMFVVDPVFQDKFQVAKTTPAFASLLSCLPEVFVGTAEQLVPLVQLVCNEVRLGVVVAMTFVTDGLCEGEPASSGLSYLMYCSTGYTLY